MNPIHIVGGGLAGCEAAWQIAAHGVRVILHEMRPQRATAAHKTDSLAELVCSNSFRSDDHEHNAVGLLHEEEEGEQAALSATASELVLGAPHWSASGAASYRAIIFENGRRAGGSPKYPSDATIRAPA